MDDWEERLRKKSTARFFTWLRAESLAGNRPGTCHPSAGSYSALKERRKERKTQRQARKRSR